MSEELRNIFEGGAIAPEITPELVREMDDRWNRAANESLTALWALNQPQPLGRALEDVIGQIHDLHSPDFDMAKRHDARIEVGRQVGYATQLLLAVQEELEP